MDGHVGARPELVQRWSVHCARPRALDERRLGGLEARERIDRGNVELVGKRPVFSRASWWRCRCEVAIPRDVHGRSPRKKSRVEGTSTDAEAQGFGPTVEEPIGQPSCDDAPEIAVGATTSRGWKPKLPVALDSIRKRRCTTDGDKQLGNIVNGCRIGPMFL